MSEAEVSTRYGISGVKVWISYSQKKGDVLYPKRTKYSKYRKGRCSRGCKPDGTKLGFGRYGTKSCKAGRLSYRAIEAARRAIIGHLHRAMRPWPIIWKTKRASEGKGCSLSLGLWRGEGREAP